MERKITHMRQKKIFAALAAVIAIVMVITSLNFNFAYAGEVDNETVNSYEDSLGMGNVMSTENAGRIWTDKSVYNEDINLDFAEAGGDSYTVQIGEEEAFLVSYSALALSERITGKTQAPVDVVFVIDISGSMNEDLGDGTRISKTIDALNSSIDKLMKMNSYTRVGVVAYSNTSREILPLDHYTTNRTDGKYFYMNDGKDRLRWDLKNSSEKNVRHPSRGNNGWDANAGGVQITGGTNIQMGIYEGMNMLATQQSTKVTIGSQEVPRIPSVILLSDGAPTYSSSSSSWWKPENNDNDGPGGSSYYGNGMKAMMTASYMKNAIDRNYDIDEDSVYRTTVYTIGMGTEQLSGSDRNLANVTLNPTVHLRNENNSMAKSILDAWTSYLRGESPQIAVDNRENYTVTHPSQYDIDNINYVDSYYVANNASAVDKVFEEIVNNIAVSAPQVPTQITGVTPEKDGYITYTDPIGEYLVLKDMKAIIWNSYKFENKTVSTTGNTTTYTFEGDVDTSLYDKQNLKDIIIQVTTAADGKQTLVIKIPATLIPVHIQNVALDSNGAVEDHTSNEIFPMRFIYSVGFQDSENPLKGVSDEYIKNNTTADGKSVNFYSNLYTGKKIEERTVGDALTTFTPSVTNPFYFYQEDTPLYLDAEGTQRAKKIERDQVYYTLHSYYEADSIVEEYKPIKGSFIIDEVITGSETEGLYIKAGSPSLGNLAVIAKVKEENKTNTAEIRSYPAYNAEGTDGINDDFIIYMGNNGLVQIDAPPSLIVKKVVTADEGLTPPDKEFGFTVNIPAIKDKTVKAILHEDGKADVAQDLKFDDKGKATFKLKANQALEIINVPGGSEYTVTEANNDGGFSLAEGEEYERTGTMPEATASDKAEDVTEIFTNHYSVTPIDVPSIDEGLIGTKNITGRDFMNGDEFTFTIEASSTRPNSPLPIGKDNKPVSEVTIAPESGNSTTFNFGKFHFDKPGTYAYVIKEVKPDEGIIGIDYDPTLYGLKFEITDSGNGTLASDIEIYKKASASVVDWELIYPKDDAGTINEQIVFTNGYDTTDASVIMEGKKELRGKSLADIADDYSDNQQFKYMFKAAGVRNIGTDDEFSPVDNQPMPEGTEAGGKYVCRNNIAGIIQIPAITYTHDNVGKEYKYTIREMQPTENGEYDGEPLEGAVKNGKDQWVYKGFTFDNTVKEAIVTVTSANIESDNGQQIEAVKAVIKYYNAGGSAPSDEGKVFVNSYSAEGSIGLKGTKKITGRDFKEGDEFKFTVEPQDDAPAPKDAQGNDITSVTINPKNGNETDVDFGNIKFTTADMKYAVKNEDGKWQKSFIYKFKEEAGNIGGINYDTAEKTVVIKVVDYGFGNLTATVSSVKPLEWNNSYIPVFTGEPVDITGLKTLKNEQELDRGELDAGDFRFSITPIDNAPMKGINPVAANDADGNIEFFNNVKYDKAGVYKYNIKEIISKPAFVGCIYDRSEYTVTVTVSDTMSGGLTANTEIVKTHDKDGKQLANPESVDKITFNNEYRPERTGAIKTTPIDKILDGKNLEAGQFKFKMSMQRRYPANANPNEGFILPENKEVANDADGNIKFDPITFTETGLYILSVEEIIPDGAVEIEKDGETYYIKDGITYDNRIYTKGYQVTDKDGKLEVVTVAGDVDYFQNEYNAEGELDGAANLKVSKKLTGRDWKETDEFKFTLAPDDLDESTMTAIEDGDIILPETEITISGKDTDKEKAFGNIKFKKAGTYKFNIWEDDTTIGGITVDDENYRVTVKVTDDGKGNLNCTSSVTKNNGDKADSIVFNNTYVPASGSIARTQLYFKKQLTGRDWLDGESFTFSMTSEDKNAPMPEDEQGNTVTSVTVDKPAKGNSDYVSFPAITYTSDDMGGLKEKQFVYKVKEVIPDPKAPGMSYDTAERIMTVTVTDDGDGALAASAAFQGSKTFTNKYESSLTYGAAGGLDIAKTLTGRDMTKDQFAFRITAKNDESAKLISKKATGDWIRVKAPAAADGETVVMSPLNEIEFTQQDAGKTYEYDIHEEFEYDKVPAGYTYDSTEYTVTIDVADDGHGIITVKTTVNDGEKDTVYTGTKEKPVKATVPFNNKYEANGSLGGDAAVKIKADKTLRGRDLKAGEFKFEVKDIKDNVVATGSNAAAANGQSGTVTFSEINYTAESVMKDVRNDIAVKHVDDSGNITYTYQYIVSEILSDEQSKQGITKEDGEFSIEVVIADDGRGHLTPAVTYPEGKDSLEFKNAYNTAPLNVELKGVKILDSDETGLTIRDIAGKYEFTIKSDDVDAPMPEKTTVANDSAGNVDFGKVRLTSNTVEDAKPDENGVKTKIFTYKVTESGSVAGVVNDQENVKTFKLTVKDDGKGGLSAVTEPVNEAKFTFTNIYGTTPNESSMTGDGGFTVTKKLTGRDLKAGEFKFVLKDGEKTVAEGTNDANGNVEMSKIRFTKPGTYQYTLKEVNGGENIDGVTYDGISIEVIAVVTDNKDGTLSVKWQGVDAGDKDVTFNNSYKPESIAVSLAANKNLTGRDLKAGEFAFELKDENGNVIQTKKNNAQGGIIFDEIRYDKEGTYNYTIAEVKGDDKTITYDDKAYNVTVTVKDSGNGSMEATTEIEGGSAIFTNKYTPTDNGVTDNDGGKDNNDNDSASKTGDDSNMILFMLMMLIAATVSGIVLIRRKLES